MKISVLTPSYNASKFIERAIQSVTCQNYTNWEHIVMDGGSTDGTVEILKKYPTTIWQSKKDKGQSDAMNKAFEIATGDIIVYLNADDEFKPGIFEKIIHLFKSNTDKLLVIADLEILDENGNAGITQPSPNIKDILDPDKLSYPYNPVSYFYSKNLQKAIGNFPDKFHLAMDYWFLLNAYNIGKVIYLPEVAGVFHNYDNKTSSNIKSEIEVLDVLMDFIKKRNPLFYFLNSFWLKARSKRKAFVASL